MFQQVLLAASTDSAGIEGRIQNLELMRDNLQREVDLHKQELATEIHKTNLYVLFGIVSSIFGVGWVLLGVRNVGKLALAKAELIIDEQLKLKLPESTQKKLKDMVETVIPNEIEPFLQVVRFQKAVEEAKSSTKVVLLAEDPERGKVAEKDFRDNGFRDISVQVPTDNELPEAELVVFVRREPKPDQDWQKLSNQFVKRMLDQNRDNLSVAFFYYGPQNEALNTKMHPRLGFANMPSTISARYIELFKEKLQSPKP